MTENEHLRVRIGDCTAAVTWDGEPSREDLATLVAILQAAWHLDTVAATQEQIERLKLLRQKYRELGTELDAMQQKAKDQAERLRAVEEGIAEEEALAEPGEPQTSG